MPNYDPGPPDAFEQHFATLPDPGADRHHFWYDWGPIFYRGRLDGSARLLCVASDPGPTERIAMRTLVGDAGQRVQGFLAKLGLSSSYVLVNAHAYALHPSSYFPGLQILGRADLTAWRNALLDKIVGLAPAGTIKAVVAFGGQAQKAIDLWDGIPAGLAVFKVPHPSARDIDPAQAWAEAITHLRQLVAADPSVQPAPNYGSKVKEQDYAAIPRHDLPFGVQDWLGDDAAGRAAHPSRRNCVDRPSDDLEHTLRWRAPAAVSHPAMPMALTGVFAAAPQVIDPMDSPKSALRGRVVTMDAQGVVLGDGVVYVDKGAIVAVRPHQDPAPDGFEQVPVINTRSTLYPGLIELHNHLPYNVLPLWQVASNSGKPFTNRDQWGGLPAKRDAISGPMEVLGRQHLELEIVLYTEAKCLAGGVTTSQGVTLFSASGIAMKFRGLVRNVERTDDPGLPNVKAVIPDLTPKQIEALAQSLPGTHRYVMHLCEGLATDKKTAKYFKDLSAAAFWQNAANDQKIVGIHSVGLSQADWSFMHQHKASMVWSPLSNHLLYGATADVAAAKQAGTLIGLGSDWSPTGSKSLFGELKFARLAGKGVFNDQELVAMATVNAARILGWEQRLGSLEQGKYADIIAVSGTGGDPYTHLLSARESAIHLVMINGYPRFATSGLMGHFGLAVEKVHVAKSDRQFYLVPPPGSDYPATGLSFADAGSRLSDALAHLPELVKDTHHALKMVASGAAVEYGWSLDLDMQDLPGAPAPDHGDAATPPKLAGHGMASFAVKQAQAVAAALPKQLKPVELDPLTVADDAKYLATMQLQPFLDPQLKAGLHDSF